MSKMELTRIKKVIDDVQKQWNDILFNSIFYLNPITKERYYWKDLFKINKKKEHE